MNLCDFPQKDQPLPAFKTEINKFMDVGEIKGFEDCAEK